MRHHPAKEQPSGDTGSERESCAADRDYALVLELAQRGLARVQEVIRAVPPARQHAVVHVRDDAAPMS